MTLALAVAVLLIPHVRINTDMTRYLPDSYTVKQGMDLMEAQLPELNAHAQDFGTVFADGTDLMPTGLPRTLALGVALLFVVLLVMCSSVMEVGLFLLTTGYAVLLNMGTNALLPSVSMLTNTLTAVLQMVLSMDYCIILMNAFRAQKQSGKEKVEAMEAAIRDSSSSILSSALTTIVSLLMLCFIRLKIGADLGVVLAKGVTLSLLCNFTVLPALILWGNRAVEATRKKVPVFPAAKVARFERRFRYWLAGLFLLFFVSFALLKNRTQLIFSPTWNSTATVEQSDENALLLLYPTAEEKAVPALLERIEADPSVHQTVSYPSIVDQPRTVSELKALLGELAVVQALPIPDDMLSVVYYAAAHPRRTEQFSLREIQKAVEDFSAEGLLPAGSFDLSSMVPAPRPLPDPVRPVPEPPVVLPADTAAAVHPDTLQAPPVAVETPVPAPDTLAAPAPRLSYEEAIRSRTAGETAAFLQADPEQIAMVYRLAGRRRGRMTLMEFSDFIQQKILPNRLYASFVPKGMEREIALMRAELGAVIAAGPVPAAAPEELPEIEPLPAVEDSLATAPIEAPEVAVVPPPVPVVEEEALPATPMDRLLEMSLSGRRYGVEPVYKALSAARIPVSREQVELLYLFMGARSEADSSLAIAPGRLLNYVADTLLAYPALAAFVPDSLRAQVPAARDELLSRMGQFRGPEYSAAVVLSGYERESAASFAFVDRLESLAAEALQGQHYWVGESRMYKELKDGFHRELLLLTLLTVLSIFLIVAFNFRSLVIPIPLVMTIMGGIYVNVWASGLGGNTLYYLAYLIVQSILMGATIDYTILFTHYYKQSRREQDVLEALTAAYRESSHSILTSGLILSLVPALMSLVMDDPMIASILKSLFIGAFAILLLVLFLLPGVIAALDRILHFRK